MTHVPCPYCDTGWLMPEPGEWRLKPCPHCHGTGYITVHRTDERAKERPATENHPHLREAQAGT